MDLFGSLNNKIIIKEIEMLQNKQNILLIIIIVLVGYSIFNTNSIRTDVKGYKAEIELLQIKVDSAKIVNKQIETKIDSVKENVVSITKEIHQIDKSITIIKKQTDEKTGSVDKFSNAELEFFFTNRYNKDITPK
jgi:peptidoglycan hydrolase CwlO-like protein